MSTTAEETEKTTKTELLLDSLEIKGYRCFEHLTIEKLGRVNLIVGKNNVGKTALLEAIEIYASFGSSINIYESLILRNECPPAYGKDFEDLKGFEGIRHILRGRPKINKKVSFSVGKLKNRSSIINFTINPPESTPNITFDKTPHKQNLSVLKISTIRTIDILGVLGKNLDLIIKNLKFIFPDLKNLKDVIFNDVLGHETGRSIFPYLIFEDNYEPIPIGSLGEGTNHLFVILLTLARCKDGILLIDEIENGLHYSVLPDVWKLIFKTAKDLNVQVFATTHSYDCIQAFAEAAIEDEESEGNLIRLVRKNDEIRAFTFDEKQLETITKENIEVR